MADTNVRVPEETVAALKVQADHAGLSLSAHVQQVLTREIEWGPSYAQRPVALPVGFASVSDELEKAAQDKQKGKASYWIVGYRTPSNLLIAVVGEIEKAQPTYIRVEIWGSNGVKVAIPRSSLICWHKLREPTNPEIFDVMHPWQRFGFYLHPAVPLLAREVNGILTPPHL